MLSNVLLAAYNGYFIVLVYFFISLLKIIHIFLHSNAYAEPLRSSQQPNGI